MRCSTVWGSAEFLQHDVTQQDQWADVMSVIEKKYGRLDVLVNNAGVIT